MKRYQVVLWLLFAIASLCLTAIVDADMPALLPSNWTMENTPVWGSAPGSTNDGSSDARWQAISFFIAGLLVSAWAVK